MAERLKTALALFAVCLLTLAFLEFSSRVAVFVIDGVRGRFFPSIDARGQLPAYAGSAYDAGLLFREENAADQRRYRPYTVWSRAPFQGELIQIDEEGERWTRPGAEGPPELDIWILGGSTTWGLGAPDAETIPSHLASLLAERHGVRARVRNLGEIGFVSTQEIVRLLRELQRGRRPDFVVFFDGVNDAAAAALWPEIPGSHMNLVEIRDRFERRSGPPSPGWTLLTRTGIYSLSQRIVWMLPLRRPAADVPWDPPEGEADIAARARQGIAIWLENLAIVRAFARAYDFEFLFVLQPSLMVGDKLLDPSEAAILSQEKENAAKLQSMQVYAAMRSGLRRRLAEDPEGLDRVRDLSDAFRNVEKALYVDYVHISGEGNRILAEQIGRLVASRLCAEPDRPARADLGTLCAEQRGS
jgi:lysophospholipase L1-like esterase